MPAFSPFDDLNLEASKKAGRIPLVWARSTAARPWSNFGDALSPVVCTALSGKTAIACGFEQQTPRMSSCGTIGQNLRRGVVHVWGTGFDLERRAFEPRDRDFAAAPDTRYVVHATRGPNSRRVLLECGVYAPPIYGDPGWLLPKILRPEVSKTHELGIIPHILELDGISDTAMPTADRRRYHVDPALEHVKVIPTWHAPSWAGFQAKLVEILSCRRIISNSFHGKVIADAYGIPCAYFPNETFGGKLLATTDLTLDHRARDFYFGARQAKVLAYGQAASELTDWTAAMKIIDEMWTPMVHPTERGQAVRVSVGRSGKSSG
ncbi:MAG: polysaccharide pyruvyl transferase family protein [Caulobacteraceae bacterium]